MLSALLASIGYAGGIIIDKMTLSVFRVSIKSYLVLLFTFLAGVTLVFLPFLGDVDSSFFTNFPYILLFILMLVVAVTYNILSSQSLQKENLHEYELIMLLTPLATIIFASIFLPSERDWGVIIAGIIASLAFLASRWRRHHFIVSKNAKRTLLAMTLIAFESILIKGLLDYFSPAALYFARTSLIAITYYMIYKPKNFSVVPLKHKSLIFVSALFGVLQMVLKYYGFSELGVIETTILLLLGPFLVYGFSFFFFNEKQHAKNDVFCAVVVVMCIVYSTLAR